MRYEAIKTKVTNITFSFLAIFLLFACTSNPTEEDNDYETVWPLSSDSANLAILIIDFDTYNFEGGYFSVQSPCNSCDKDSIPLSLEFIPIGIGDLPGVVLLEYVETGDTVFLGTFGGFNWPTIHFPMETIPPDSFNTVDIIPSEPISFEYLYKGWMNYDENLYRPKADSTWNVVHDLDIVADFAYELYRVLILMFALDKWIVFLYR